MRIVLLSVLLFVLAACSGSKEPREAQPLDALPTITPDYVDLTMIQTGSNTKMYFQTQPGV